MKRFSVLLFILMVLAVSLFFWWQNGLGALSPHDRSEKIFVIKKGSGVKEISSGLKKDRLIKDPIVFFLLVKQRGLDDKIQAGDFRLSPSMDAKTIAENLTHGTLDVWITIPEGKRAEEIGEILKNALPSYQPSWNEALKGQEGYLFPDTYLMPKNAELSLVIALLRDTFEKKYAALIEKYPTRRNKKEIITLASLVEREAKFPNDRPLVASVLLNRLSIGMALQIDATIQYALGYQPNEHSWWKKHLTKEDIQLRSPYNTYGNPGLPPTPIANPGTAAIEAILHPANTDYLYYLSDKNGKNHYAKTFEEHRGNIEKYGL